MLFIYLSAGALTSVFLTLKAQKLEETIRKSIEHSDAFFLYDKDRLVGFGRVITDYATNYYSFGNEKVSW